MWVDICWGMIINLSCIRSRRIVFDTFGLSIGLQVFRGDYQLIKISATEIKRFHFHPVCFEEVLTSCLGDIVVSCMEYWLLRSNDWSFFQFALLIWRHPRFWTLFQSIFSACYKFKTIQYFSKVPLRDTYNLFIRYCYHLCFQGATYRYTLNVVPRWFD